jgi:hypothetical protein
MKVTSLKSAFFLFVLAIGPSGCKRHEALPAGAVVFQGAGVALVPGEHWKQLESGPFTEQGEICLPVLQGEGELNGVVIQVRSSPTDRSSPDRRAASLREQVDLRPEVIKDSFKQEKFTTDSGLTGVHISYELELEANGKKVKGRNHVYVVQNARGAIVGLSVGAVASRDIEPVHQMIRKTLRLE